MKYWMVITYQGDVSPREGAKEKKSRKIEEVREGGQKVLSPAFDALEVDTPATGPTVAIDISYLQNCLLVSAKIAVQCTVIVKRSLTFGPLPGTKTVFKTPPETTTVSAITDMSSEHQAEKIF